MIYRDRPDIGAVLHTHSVKATVLSRLVAEGESVVFEDYELQRPSPAWTPMRAG